jgi:hypothetical protein
MYIVTIPKAKSIYDLQRHFDFNANLKSPASLRKSFPIAVIDDQPFLAEQNLKNNDFQIKTFRDISNIDDVKEFPIVLCDLQGVGTKLATELQGAYLIEEIKSNYPEKIVIAYTGGSSNSVISKKAMKAADSYLKKDAAIDEWRDTLDSFIKQLSDPVYVWKKLRIRLVTAGITPLELVELEDAFVRNYPKGSITTKNALNEKIADSKVDGSIKKELMSFVASKIFDLLFEAIAK